MELHLKHVGGREVVRVSGSGHQLLVEGERVMEATLLRTDPDALWFDLDGMRHRARFWRDGHTVFIHLDGRTMRFELEDPDDAVVEHEGESSPVLRSPMPGRILEILVAEGATVSRGDPVVRLEAMKMEIDLAAPCDGRVASVPVGAGDLVEPDAELLRIEPDAGN